MNAALVIALAAFLLAAGAGFAAQRGSICAVAAVFDLVVRRDARRYLALLEAALWSLAAAGFLSLFAGRPAAFDYPAGALAAAGGALFGAGAAINGACAFGSAARLARGELAFLFMPAGMLTGAFLAAHALPAPAGTPAAAPASPFLAAFLVFFAGWRIFGAMDRIRTFAALRAALRAPRWRPSAAMAMVGVLSAILMAVYAPWPYSTLLVELGAGSAAQAGERAAVALFFIAGAAAAARLAGDFRVAAPRPAEALQKFAGGALMGTGAYLVPGGNDAMVLRALPNLLAYGFIAYAAMTATIAAIILSGRIAASGTKKSAPETGA
ncbi:MAG TPA: hypothetical protein DDZ68_07175 [Parvularcula sp.]|nr:hypothetical protein [Parvularcula sp.]HBS32600.1 hypothetical protein [Parvularcula sp.]